MSVKDSLKRLLYPKSIAVIGGGDWCRAVIEQNRSLGFSGDIWVVHPTRSEVAGIRAEPSVDNLPAAPDAAFVGVNREATVDAVAQLREKGAGGAVCFASGFAESRQELTDGPALQDALLEAAGPMRLIGPNCYGLINYLEGAALWPDRQGGKGQQSGVAIITQSSNIALNLTMQRRGLPIAFVATVGNQAETGLSELGEALLADPRITALGLYIEGIDDLRSFERLGETARSCGKSIVVLKAGRSDLAKATSLTHTASLAGSDAGARALFARLGMGQVSSLSALVETLKILHVCGPLKSNAIASLSCSGGEASLMADAALAAGLAFPALNDRQMAGLKQALGPKVSLCNPLDYHTYIWGVEDALSAAYSAMLDPVHALGIVVLDYPREDRCDIDEWRLVETALNTARINTGQPVAVLSTLSDTMPEEAAARLMEMGIVPLAGMSEALEAVRVAADIGSSSANHAPSLVPGVVRNGPVLEEARAKAALAHHGLPLPASMEAASPEDAARAAAKLGFPVVLKVQGVAHKTEVGGVRLNLICEDDVRNAAQTMPGDRFLIEEMIADTVVELLVGVVRDPAHGYVLTLAAGGTLTELLSDRVSLLVPSARDDILSALSRLKVSRLLEGYRGAPGANKEAIVDAVMAVQGYVTKEHPVEVEINPLMCGPDKAVAADALIKTGEGHE